MDRIRIGLIPAAGEGKRLGYLSYILPKCLFPLYDKPIIHHIVDNMKSVGVEQIYVIVNYQKDKVIEYFEQVQDEIGVGIDFIEQTKLSGIANAIMLARGSIDEPFMVILGDDCTITESLDNIARLFFEHDATVVEGIVTEDDEDILKSTCCLSLDEDRRIVGIEEKPKEPFSNFRGCGIYVFQTDIFNYIEKTPPSLIRSEVEITETIALVSKDGRAYGEFINGMNINVNSYEDLLQAWILMKKNSGLMFSFGTKESDIAAYKYK